MKAELSGVVVLYNPDLSIVKNISTYINHLGHLYIIDNSESCNCDLISLVKSLSHKISYYTKESNLGIATALNIGCELAFQDGFNWILTMDQDSSIKEGFFAIAQPLVLNNENIIIAASYNQSFYKPRKSRCDGFIEVGTVITSGNLLNLNGWKGLKGFCEKLFIDEVDNEFCIRARKNGYKILTSEEIYLDHNLGSSYVKNSLLTNKKLNLTKHSSTRVYYMARNNLFLWKNYIFINPALVYNRVKNLVKLTIEITLYYPNKPSYYKNMIKGFFHFLISRYGKM